MAQPGDDKIDRRVIFGRNFNWQAQLVSEVKRILKQNAMYLIEIEIATPEQDMKQATDMVVKVIGGEIAVRLRRPNVTHRDFTVRAYMASGHDTEIHKLRRGFGRWYLYGWMDHSNVMDEWLLVDLNALRRSGLLNVWRPFIPNKGKDDSQFISISIDELRRHSCITAGRIKRKAA